ncbi:MAG TPA: ATP-binding protein [Candidatus Deferrimicrobiaceae bacterium]
MKRDISVRAGVVVQLTMIAVASLSLLAVFALKAIELSMERRHVEAAVSVAYAVRGAVEGGGVARISPYIREIELLSEAPPAGGPIVAPAGEKSGGILSLHPAVDVTLPLAGGKPGSRGIRVRYFSPGIEEEARHLVQVAGVLVGIDVIVMVLFGAFLMDRSVVRPIRRLAAVSEKIAAGDNLLRADESPENELGQLGASFNRMVAAMQSAQEKARQAEHDTFRSEKLATVGRLAAGVAHEVGNPLMAVRGYAEYLRKTPPSRAEQDECLDRIVGETQKIENIVRGLLSVAAPGAREGEDADVDAVVRETVELLSFRRIFRDVDVRVECGGAGRARISSGRLQQVLLNLLINAVDSMGNGGTIKVRTFPADPWIPPPVRAVRRRASDPPWVDVAPLRGGVGRIPPVGAAVSVTDTGCGIRQVDMENIFDPFFTTKEPGKGTGLGLSVSRAIVEGAGGEILAESQEGKGSTFTVIVPSRGEAAGGEKGGEGADG